MERAYNMQLGETRVKEEALLNEINRVSLINSELN